MFKWRKSLYYCFYFAREDRAKAVEILKKDLKVFSSAEDLRNDTKLLTVENFR